MQLEFKAPPDRQALKVSRVRLAILGLKERPGQLVLRVKLDLQVLLASRVFKELLDQPEPLELLEIQVPRAILDLPVPLAKLVLRDQQAQQARPVTLVLRET